MTWAPVTEGSFVTFSGGDNTNASAWISNGKAKIVSGRDILAGFQLCVAIHALGPQPFLMRTHRNTTADFITRASPIEIEELISREGFSRVAIPWWWGDIALLSKQFKWGGCLPEETPLEIPKGPNPLRTVQWGGPTLQR